MKTEIEFRNFEADQKLQRVVERRQRRLERLLNGLVGPKEVRLRGVVEKHPERALYQATLALDLPRRRLPAQESGSDATAVTALAFDEIERLLKRHKAMRRRQEQWPGARGRVDAATGEQTRAAVAGLSEADRAAFRRLIEQNLQALYNFARRELGYYVAAGDLPPGALSVEDVVDAVVLRAAQNYKQRPGDLDENHWLMQLTLDYLRSEAERLKRRRSRVLGLEGDVSRRETPGPPWIHDDHLWEFHQPDDVYWLEDLMPDPDAPTPEEVVESSELQRYVSQALAQLPRAWRIALVLHAVEGLSVAEIACMLNAPEEEIKREIEWARQYLAEKIRQTGLLEDGRDPLAMVGPKTTEAVPDAYRQAVNARLRSGRAAAQPEAEGARARA